MHTFSQKRKPAQEGKSANPFRHIFIYSGMRNSIQPKLKVNAPRDQCEQEADRFVDETLQEKMPAKKDETLVIHTRASLPAAGSEREVHAELENLLNQSKGSGNPIPEQVRASVEPRMQFDFSKVKIHTDNEAVQMNQELGARAFTYGRDIYFGVGQYNPQSIEGNRLLVHELTHVLQQTKSDSPLTGDIVQLTPMRHGRRRRAMAIRWSDFDNFLSSVRAQSVRRLGVPPTWLGQLLSETSLRPIYDELERSNQLRPDGEIVRIVADFNAGGDVGNSTLRIGIAHESDEVEESPEREPAVSEAEQTQAPMESVEEEHCEVPHRLATEMERRFWLHFFPSYLARRFLNNYMDARCETITLSHPEMVDCNPYPDVNVLRSDRFNAERNRLTLARGGTSELSFSAPHTVRTNGTLGNFTINFRGQLTVDIDADPYWSFEGMMDFEDVFDFNPMQFGSAARPWHAELRVRVAQTIPGNPFQVRSVEVPVRQNSNDQNADWRQGLTTQMER